MLSSYNFIQLSVGSVGRVHMSWSQLDQKCRLNKHKSKVVLSTELNCVDCRYEWHMWRTLLVTWQDW